MLLKKLALWLHKLHFNAYTFYKVRQSGVTTYSKMSAVERDFFLQLQPALQGKELIVYDIGAARGDVSKCFSKLTNVVLIHAFEPLPVFFSELEAQMSSIDKVICHNIALGNKPGIFPINVNNWATSSSFLPASKVLNTEIPDIHTTNSLDIEIFKLDGYVQSKQLPLPNIIKIDVQGFEAEVIKGGIHTISQCDFCIIEMSFQELYEGSPLFDDIFLFMHDLNFRLVSLTKPMTSHTGMPLQVDGIFKNERS